MDERDASLQSLREKYQQKAKSFNEEADNVLSEAIANLGESTKKKAADAEKAADEIYEKAAAAARAAIEEEDTKAFDEVRSLYGAYGVRK